MALKVGELYALLKLDDKGFGAKIDHAKSKFAGLGDTGRSVATFFGISFGVSMATAGASAIAAANNMGAFAEKLDNLAQTTGLNTAQLQELKYVAETAGLSFEGLIGTSTVLQRKLMGVEEDTGNAAKVIERLGVSVYDSSGQLRSMTNLFPELISKLQNMANETERNMLAAQIFGRNLADVAPILGMTSKELEEARKRAHELGVVLDGDALSAAKAFDDKMDDLQQSIKGMGNAIMKELMPSLGTLGGNTDLQDWGTTVGKALSMVFDIAKRLWNLFTLFPEATGGMMRSAVYGLQGLDKGIRGDFKAAEGYFKAMKLKAEEANDVAKDKLKTIFGKSAPKKAGKDKKPSSILDMGVDTDSDTSGSDAKSARDVEAEKALRDKEAALDRDFQISLRHADRIKKLELSMKHEMSKAGPLESSAIKRDYTDQIKTELKEMQAEDVKRAKDALDEKRRIWEQEAQAYESSMVSRLDMANKTYDADRQGAWNTVNQQIRSLALLAEKGEGVYDRLTAVYDSYRQRIMSIDKQESDAKLRMLQEQADKAEQVAQKQAEADEKRMTMMQKLYVTAVGLTQGETQSKVAALELERTKRIEEAQKTLTDHTELQYAMAVIDADTEAQKRKLFEDKQQVKQVKPISLSWLSSGADVWKNAMENSVKQTAPAIVETKDTEVASRLASIERLLQAQNSDNRSGSGFSRIATAGAF